MSKSPPASGQEPVRRDELVGAAAKVFTRYGFRKTSMDDVARAAQLSRQGVYFYFSTKEELFRAVVGYLAEVTLEAARTALAREDLGLDVRLLGAFEAMSTRALGECDPANVQELFASAAELAREVVQALDDQIVSALAAALARQGKPRSGIAPRALAEHLYAASYGLKHRGLAGEEYLARMKIAVRIVAFAAEPRAGLEPNRKQRASK